MTGCKISDAGARALANGLQSRGCQLQELNLSGESERESLLESRGMDCGVLFEVRIRCKWDQRDHHTLHLPFPFRSQ